MSEQRAGSPLHESPPATEPAATTAAVETNDADGGIPSGNSNGNGNVNGKDEAKPITKDGPPTGPPQPKQSKFAEWQAKAGLDWTTLKLMAKGATTPVVALALYQYPPFARTFPTIAYLVAISGTLSIPFQTRSKFMQTLFINVVAICFGACVALLTCYCAVQARIHTSVPVSTTVAGASGTTQALHYNSSASAVAAVWLFFNVLASNSLRFSRPQLQIPIIIYSTFANISGTFAPLFATMDQAIGFVKMLLEAYLSGFAIALVVNLVIFPMSSRQVLFKQFGGYVRLLQGVMAAQLNFLEVMEHDDMLRRQDSHDQKSKTKAATASAGVRACTMALQELHTKLHQGLPFAKRELAWGKLSPEDLDDLYEHFRNVFAPILGLTSLSDIFMRANKSRGWDDAQATGDDGSESKVHMRDTAAKEQADWNEIMKVLHQPFQQVTTTANQGLQHALWVLELGSKPDSVKKAEKAAKAQDVEAAASKAPGGDHYAEELQKRLRHFGDARKAAMRVWCEQRGVHFDDVTLTPEALGELAGEAAFDLPNRRYLYLVLYMEYLLKSVAKAVLDLVRFADAKVADGTMKKSRLITPGRERIRKWIASVLAVDDGSSVVNPDGADAGDTSIYLGDAYRKRKDPEHLPPTNARERAGDRLRQILGVLGSQEVAFGFRVACATMSIAILAYLEPTQAFFIEQRIVWAMIMVVIGMTMTTGSGVFGFIGRVAGTFVAMVTSLIIWYMSGGRGIPGAVLPLLWIFSFVEMWLLIKKPALLVIALISMVTQILILGYEMQADTIGVVAISGNGQKYYPIYELAPYRLATVAAGCAVAFFWTYFPYPLTARTALRKQLGLSVYLLANFYSCVHTSIQMRLRDEGGQAHDKDSPRAQLNDARNKVTGQLVSILSELRQHSSFVRFEPTLGGKFPKAAYDLMIVKVQHLLGYISLLEYATRLWRRSSEEEGEHGQWFADLRTAVTSLKVSSHETTSLLILISSSLSDGNPLPPYLSTPETSYLTERIRALDPDVLGLQHILEPGYAAFAVTQVVTRLIDDDLKELLGLAKALVGEVDFSYHIESTTVNSSETMLAPGEKGKRD